MGRAGRVAAIVFAAFLGCKVASAQEVSSGREAPHARQRAEPNTDGGDDDTTRRTAAAALFAEGRAQMAAGDLASACVRFAESDRLEPAPGTKLNLADCYEREGRLASAWITFSAAESEARRLGRENWVAIARARTRLLDPRLPRLTLVLAEGAPAVTSIHCDGTTLMSAAAQTPIPVDPGPHEIEAFAGEVRVFESRVDAVSGKATTVTIVPSRLFEAPAAPPPAPNAETPVASWRVRRGGGAGSRFVEYGLLAGGAAGVAAGSVMGAIAFSENASARAACPHPSACGDRSAVAESDAAHRDALISDIAFAVGGTLVTAGVVLFFARSPSSTQASVACAPIDRGFIVGASGSL
jgi:hypothetical protein